MERITDLGEIGAINIGLLRPLILVLDRDGDVWDLTGYDQPVLKVWNQRTGVAVTPGGSAAILQDDGAGTETGIADAWYVRYTPSATDPLFALSGVYDARVTVRPGSGDPEPSGLFRFRIGGR